MHSQMKYLTLLLKRVILRIDVVMNLIHVSLLLLHVIRLRPRYRFDLHYWKRMEKWEQNWGKRKRNALPRIEMWGDGGIE